MSQKIIVISPYPPKNTTYENKYSALASFCKNKITALQKNSQRLKILVLADVILQGNSWQEKNLEIRRVWERNRLGVYFSLLREILKESYVKKILIELEWALFGKKVCIIALMPFFVLVLRILGKEVFVVLHGITLDFLSLSPQLGFKKKSLKAKIYDRGVKLFYTSLVFFSSKIIVLEQYFANLINQKLKTQKAIFIPHGVDTSMKIISQKAAKRNLGIDQKIFVILNFGFFSWYKGTELLTKFFLKFVKKQPKQNILLILAGGESFVHRKNPIYQQFVYKIKEMAKQTEQIMITGFIPESKLSLYLSAADAFIFPYRLFISSSGPLSLAFSFEKPVLLSQRLAGYFESLDMKEALYKTGLKKKDILFSLNETAFVKKIVWLGEPKHLKKLVHFSALMKEKRSWEKISQEYLEILHQ